MKKVTKAIIPAAGLGTRFLPATKGQPKEMLPIIDKPSIQYVIEEVVSSGITDIIIISSRNKRSIEDHFDKSYELESELEKTGKTELLELVRDISNMANIHYVRQKEANGLGKAIYCAKSFIGDEPFAVLLGDDIVRAERPCIKQLIDVYDNYNCSVLGVQEVLPEDISKYGAVACESIGGSTYRVSGLVEKPKKEEAPSNIAILGRYIITPEIFDCIEETPPGKNGEVQLTDALKILLSKQSMYAHAFSGKRYDVGDKMGYLKATVEFALLREDLKGEFADYIKGLMI